MTPIHLTSFAVYCVAAKQSEYGPAVCPKISGFSRLSLENNCLLQLIFNGHQHYSQLHHCSPLMIYFQFNHGSLFKRTQLLLHSRKRKLISFRSSTEEFAAIIHSLNEALTVSPQQARTQVPSKSDWISRSCHDSL